MECQESIHAQTVTPCQFGDFLGAVHTDTINGTCSEVITATPWQCYRQLIGEPCCQSCGAIHSTNIEGMSIFFMKYCTPGSIRRAFTLVRVPKNNHLKHVKGFLGSILTPKRVLGSYLTPADVLKSLGLSSTN